MTAEPNLLGEPITATAKLRLAIDVPEGWELVTVSVGPWDDTIALFRRAALAISADWEVRRDALRGRHRQSGLATAEDRAWFDYRISHRLSQ